MMRPAMIWVAFAVCLAVAFGALSWLTHQTLELDQAEWRATRQAEHEELCGRALWRMDARLIPLLAREAARSYFAYQPMSVPLGAKGHVTVDSPPLLAETEFVLLHFEIRGSNEVCSPQIPPNKQWAVQNGATIESLQEANSRLEELRREFNFEDLLAMLPEQPLPDVELPALTNVAANQGSELSDSPPGPPTINEPGGQIRNPGQPRSETEAPQNADDNRERGADRVADRMQRVSPAEPQAQRATGQNSNVLSRNRFDNGSTQQFDTLYADNYVRNNGQNVNPTQSQSVVTYEATNSIRTQEAQASANPAPAKFFNSRSVRGNDLNDLPNRDAALQAYAQRELAEKVRTQNFPQSPPRVITEGVSRPLWLGGRLLLARRVKVGESLVVQGCWLDWNQIQNELLADIADLLPGARLGPVTDTSQTSANRLLATLPVQLLSNPPPFDASAPSPIRISLVLAWSGMVLAACAVGLLLRGVMSLSERRAEFVSAVTHELRTPLTTFRMYAEMLAADMVSDPAQRTEYLRTLDAEAQRLSHLVENVLSYARLERGRAASREELIFGQTLDRFSPRLIERARAANMTVAIEADETVRTAVLHSDSMAIEQILFNLVDNACKYAIRATDRRIHVRCSLQPRSLTIQVEDHGDGLPSQAVKRLFRPFSKSVQEAAVSAPGVGLGLALCRRLARDLGGKLRYTPKPSNGATFELVLPR